MVFNVEVLDKFKFSRQRISQFPPPLPSLPPMISYFYFSHFLMQESVLTVSALQSAQIQLTRLAELVFCIQLSRLADPGSDLPDPKRTKKKKSPGSDLKISLNIFIILLYLSINIDLFFITLFYVYIHKYSFKIFLIRIRVYGSYPDPQPCNLVIHGLHHIVTKSFKVYITLFFYY